MNNDEKSVNYIDTLKTIMESHKHMVAFYIKEYKTAKRNYDEAVADKELIKTLTNTKP